MENIVSVQWRELTAQVLTFVVALFIVWRLGWKPLVKIMAERQDAIAKSVKASDEAKAAAARLEEDYTARLEQIEQKSAELASLARLEASRAREDMLRRAQTEIEQMHRKADEQLALERTKLISELKGEMVNLSVAVAEKVLRESTGIEEHRKRFEEILLQLESESLKGKAS
jgi:F-type H+-transporting ATPase subunit b